MSQYSEEIERRRTFAIISHPDAGKTTLTEKLLLFAGRRKTELQSGKGFPAGSIEHRRNKAI